MITKYFIIGLGGAAGAIARVALAGILPNTIFNIPSYIIMVNAIGCLLIGIISELLALYLSTSLNMKYFLISGFLGGFTTFSSFALDFGFLIEKGEYINSLIYLVFSITISLTCFFVGIKAVKMLT